MKNKFADVKLINTFVVYKYIRNMKHNLKVGLEYYFDETKDYSGIFAGEEDDNFLFIPVNRGPYSANIKNLVPFPNTVKKPFNRVKNTVYDRIEDFINSNELAIGCCITSFFIGAGLMWLLVVSLKFN